MSSPLLAGWGPDVTAGTWAANWNVQGSHLPGMAEQQHRSPDVRPHMELTRGPGPPSAGCGMGGAQWLLPTSLLIRDFCLVTAHCMLTLSKCYRRRRVIAITW